MNSSPPRSPVSRPIPINTHQRARSGSFASIPGLSTSPTSPFAGSVQTPASISNFTRFGQSSEGSPTSPVAPGSPLAYILNGGITSPVKGNFPFSSKPSTASAIDENDESPNSYFTGHLRRASTSGALWGSTAPPNTPMTDRGTGVLRRLSLSGVLQRPNFTSSPPKDLSIQALPSVPTIIEPKPRRKQRSASTNEPIKRGISPMGERLLKGHFDGFI